MILKLTKFDLAKFMNRFPVLFPLTLLTIVFGTLLIFSGPNVHPGPVSGYIGPGAGIALVGSFFAVLFAILSAFFALLTWPIRWCWRWLRSRRALSKAKTGRVVILGLDGLDPDLVDEFLEQGILPNLEKLKETGSYRRLQTTWPPLSPVAWSSFTTGTNPGKHNIFDFISRDPNSYLPTISSVSIGKPKRFLNFAGFKIPLSATPISGLRKSKPFWTVLGEAGIFSSVLRVPITFPPDKFHGVQLSAMCVPDLRGTQGTFMHFVETGDGGSSADGDVGGERIIVSRKENTIYGSLPGPRNPLKKQESDSLLPFQVSKLKTNSAILTISGQKIELSLGEYSDWIKLDFRMGLGIKIQGIVRFMLKRTSPGFEMYCTPINISPEKPVMPISFPKVFSIYLAKMFGSFSTLGMAEDTWALSEGVNNEEEFLQQAYDIDEERKSMFFDSLKRVKQGMVTCVFDASDRIQHMFWRFRESDHPALQNQSNLEQHRDVIRDLYVKMDELVGETVNAIGENTALFVMSDHGFKSFQRCVDLNAWLLKHGYLVLKNGAKTSNTNYLVDVDWSKTKAYALGLAGIFINQTDREAEGIVDSGREKSELIKQICEQLTGLSDGDRNEVAITEAVASTTVYKGPYVDAAPDIIIGYNVGYRVSWDAAVGKCGADVISDNTKAWSGDHCIHPELVPGILFSNMKLEKEEASIIDMAPTTLDLLGVKVPGYMEGASLCH